MVYQQGVVKSLSFEMQSTILYLSKESQPYIADLNGDFIDDVIFNNEEDTSDKGKLNVAIYN